MIASQISTDYLDSLSLLLPNEPTINLVLVGCGGTGSWLAPSIARIGRNLRDSFGKKVKIAFVDPDRVEEKNCYRQNFCLAEVGRFKAETLARRYGLAWGMEIEAYLTPIGTVSINFRGLIVVCGCVDNPAARLDIMKKVSGQYLPDTWWLDCGNWQDAGQVLLGSGERKPTMENALKFRNTCSWLPLPSEQHPELVEVTRTVQPETRGSWSCAEMMVESSQGMAINQRMAAEATDYLVRMLVTKDLRRYATYIDLQSGACRSKYITREAIEGWLK